ncbi:hypothetical protein HZC31_00635 [Candidatus Woesearchaeota archaeon]|nr:hypothetical protein [Candidatus Woesearchaeota archaeon]
MTSLHHIKQDIEDMKRLSDIATAFFMGGFSYYIKKSGLKKCVSVRCRIRCFIKRKCNCPPEKHSLPLHFREVIENLGPTFIKFGQLLSLRPDVIPEEYCAELRKLQEDVPGFSFNEVQKIIEAEFGKPVQSLFSSFDKKPIAAASIAQVHIAQLKNGKKVAVKVLRPDVRTTIEQDIRIMEKVAALFETHIPETRPFRPKRFVQEFKDWTMKELDFRNEGRIMDEMRTVFKNETLLKIPEVHWELTSKKIVTMEFIDGTHISDAKGLQKLHINKKELAINGITIIVAQTLVHGIFHGDPHPGNILALQGNRFGFLDFGIVGRVTERQRRKLSLYLIHLLERDFERAMVHILDLAETTEESDIEGFKRAFMDILAACYGSVGNSSLSDAFFRAVIAGVPYKIYFPSDLVLLSKAFVTSESVGRNLYPQFNILTDARESVEKTLKQQLHPVKTVKNLLRNSLDYGEIVEDLPLHTARVLKLIEKGSIAVTIDKKEFSGYMNEFHKANNIRVVGTIIAALVIASAITSFLQEGQQHMLSLPMIELYLALGLGIWLVHYMKNNKK